jgi:predicted NUDIX family NTP pyrophosphohydrolase
MVSQVPKSISAGLLMFHLTEEVLSVLLAHPGGPYFTNKDEGAWTIPKGLVDENEDSFSAACREFHEETGLLPPADAAFTPLGSVMLRGGKRVDAWAFAGEWETGRVPLSNTFSIEWPPHSGVQRSFPEIDRAEMFCLEDAWRKLNERQTPFLDRLTRALAGK